MNKEIQNFIYWYLKELYPHYYNGQHPFVRASQFKRCHDVLVKFMDENIDIDVDIESLKEMAESFFEKVKQTDHNINHFCTEGILKIRHTDAFGSCKFMK